MTSALSAAGPGRNCVTYRFYYLDQGGKVIDRDDADYSDEAEAIAIAELHFSLTPHYAIEVWERGKVIYRGTKDNAAKH
jgi:hypothetical protein